MIKSPITILFFAFLLLAVVTVNAQKDDIGTEVVNVVKPYTPTLSDAFKVKETPVIDDQENSSKQTIKYQIFSFPVASTFVPSKGRAAGVENVEKEKSYENYASLAAGNYATAQGELFLTSKLGAQGYVGGMLRHLSSEGGIKNVPLDDGFQNSSVDLTYGNNSQNLSWNADVGYQFQKYNWYGLPSDLTALQVETILPEIDPAHTYQNCYVGGSIRLNEFFLKEAGMKFNRFWDSFNTAENRFFVKPQFAFKLNDLQLHADVVVDYIGGSFTAQAPADQFDYHFTNVGVMPSFNLSRDAWSVNLGAAFYYGAIDVDKGSRFFVYPQVTGSLKLVEDLMTVYAGAEGGLDQNSYRNFTTENPFLAPGNAVAPTDRQYDVFAGLKGKLSTELSYNLRGFYRNEKNKPLFKASDFSLITASADYDYGNAFGIVYDDVATLGFFGEVKATIGEDVALGINAAFNSYNAKNQQEAWNLPAIKFGASADVNITKKWYSGLQLFYVGERKDLQDDLDDPADALIKTIDAFVDLNAHVGYKHNDRLTGFVRANNILGKNYERWLNFPVQGIQVVLGASYKFDF